jgi:nucleosome assembly protein 1-like 1
LEKTYLYQEEVGYAGDFVYDHAIGADIKWKVDKDLTKEFEIKKQRNKSASIIYAFSFLIEVEADGSLDTNRTRLVRKAHPTESFFNFFTPPVPPPEDAVENGELDDEELEEIDEKLEMDYQIGEDIKEKVWAFSRDSRLRSDQIFMLDHPQSRRFLHGQSSRVRSHQ